MHAPLQTRYVRCQPAELAGTKLIIGPENLDRCQRLNLRYGLTAYQTYKLGLEESFDVHKKGGERNSRITKLAFFVKIAISEHNAFKPESRALTLQFSHLRLEQRPRTPPGLLPRRLRALTAPGLTCC